MSLGSLVCVAPTSHGFMCANSWLKRVVCCAEGPHPFHFLSQCFFIMVNTADRPDPLKVFLGNLSVDVNKPKILELLSFFDLHPVDVIVPQVSRNKLAIAFLVFNTPEEANYAMHSLQGAANCPCSANGIQAGGTEHGSL